MIVVRIEFADHRLDAFDYKDQLTEAVRFARKNLWCRHDVFVKDPVIFNHEVYVILEFGEGSNLNEDTFSIGKHLRGISKYLVSNYDFQKHKVGSRLLYFKRVGSDIYEMPSVQW